MKKKLQEIVVNILLQNIFYKHFSQQILLEILTTFIIL